MHVKPIQKSTQCEGNESQYENVVSYVLSIMEQMADCVHENLSSKIGKNDGGSLIKPGDLVLVQLNGMLLILPFERFICMCSICMQTCIYLHVNCRWSSYQAATVRSAPVVSLHNAT